MNRLRCGEYFQDFDPLRKGLLPKIKFRGVLSKMKLQVSEQEMVLLENQYTSQIDPDKIDYQNFLSDIEVVFTLPVQQSIA
jgi:Ca2+-binding EF-hand superfamily protein